MSFTPKSALKDQFKSEFGFEDADDTDAPSGRRINESIVGAQGESISLSAQDPMTEDEVEVAADDAPTSEDFAEHLVEVAQATDEEVDEAEEADGVSFTGSERGRAARETPQEPDAQLSMTLNTSAGAAPQFMLTDAYTDETNESAGPAAAAGAPAAQETEEQPAEAPAEETRAETANAGNGMITAIPLANSDPAEETSSGPQKFQLSAWSSEAGETSTSSGTVDEDEGDEASREGPSEPETPEPEPDPDPSPEPSPSPSPSPSPAPTLPIADADYSVEGPTRGEARTIEDGASNAIDGGRVTTFEIDTDKDISGVFIYDMPDHGHASVNPDNSLAVVMTGSDYSGPLSLSYVVSYTDGTSETKTLEMSVAAPQQERGWGGAEHYMLEEDAAGDLIVETGENHRKVYITGKDEGLTRADIAQREGLDEAQITDQWLYENPEYGGSEDMALAEDVAMGLWDRMRAWDGDDPVSHWALFERGHTYDEFRVNLWGLNGESELHPVHFTAWGEGARPVITTEAIGIRDVQSNFVISDLSFHAGARLQSGENVILSNVEITGEKVEIQNMSAVTIHDSQIHNVVRDAPMHADWNAFADRATGVYVARSEGVLIDGSMFHRNGWKEGFEVDENSQPPSIFSHNIYIQYNTFDVTFTDNIVSQGSSYGAQFRGGVWAQDNAFVDNNAGVSFLGGVYNGSGPIGNYTYFTDNVVTSAGHKEAEQIGALAWGVLDSSYQATLLDNIIAHLADPNNAAEIEEKDNNGVSLQSGVNTHYDDTIIYGWHPSTRDYLADDLNQNVEGLDQAALDQITIQRFAATVLGDANASIGDLMDYILALPEEAFGDVSAADIIAYFQQGFGLSSSDVFGPETHRFVPNDLGDGVRWQSNINWHDDEVPEDGDSVLLGGNMVHFGGTSTITDLDFGLNGALEVAYGKLSVNGAVTTGAGTATLDITGSGQFWTNGLAEIAKLEINVASGRFANTGAVEGDTVLSATDGQVLLGVDDASFTVTDESELRLVGSELRAGFDGESGGTSVLQMEDGATLTFVADAEGLASIEEFRSGALGDEVDVQSGMSLDGTLQIDLTSMVDQSGTHTLIDVDALHGTFSDINIHGLSSNTNAEIVVDYDIDAVLIQLTAGNGAVSVDKIGTSDDGAGEDAALWDALTDGRGAFDAVTPQIAALSDNLPEPEQTWL